MKPSETRKGLCALTVFELKEKILSSVVNSPDSAAYTIRRTLNRPQGIRELATICQSIGVDLCRPVFDAISPAQWAKIDGEIRANTGAQEGSDSTEPLQRFFERLFRDSLDWNPETALQQSFAVLRRKGGAWLAALFITQEISELALLSTLWVPEEMEMIQSALPASARKEMTLGIFRLQRLPEERVLLLSLDLLKRIRNIAQGPKQKSAPVSTAIAATAPIAISPPARPTLAQLKLKTELEAQSLALGDAQNQIERLARELARTHAKFQSDRAAYAARTEVSPRVPKDKITPPPFRHHGAAARPLKAQIIPAQRMQEAEKTPIVLEVSRYSAVNAAIDRINQKLPVRLNTQLPALPRIERAQPEVSPEPTSAIRDVLARSV